MKQLSENSTRIFCALIDSLHGGCFTEIINEPFMSLHIEELDVKQQTPYGIGNQYSLCHYYEQEGDLMQDPEMCFLMIDDRKSDVSNMGKVTVIPYMFQQANLSIYQQSIIWLSNGTANIDAKIQADHAAFAETWLTNIEAQGYFNIES